MTKLHTQVQASTHQNTLKSTQACRTLMLWMRGMSLHSSEHTHQNQSINHSVAQWHDVWGTGQQCPHALLQSIIKSTLITFLCDQSWLAFRSPRHRQVFLCGAALFSWCRAAIWSQWRWLTRDASFWCPQLETSQHFMSHLPLRLEVGVGAAGVLK